MSWRGAPQKRLLLTSDRDTQNSQDSAFSSHIMSSQIQNSQCSDFSQVATQDVFSQGNSGPQTESSMQQQGTKKMSMYEKWLSKRAMFKRDPPHLPSSVDNKVNVQGTAVNSSNISFQAQGYFANSGNSNAMTRPIVDTSLRGSERELLRQVTFAIHDCSSEMKSALFTVKEKLENVTEMSNEQLAQTLTSFLDDIWKHQEKLQRLLQEQDKSRSMVADLEVRLAQKDSQIAMLEEQLIQARKDDTLRFAKAVRCELQSPQMRMESKLEKMLEQNKDTTEQQGHHLKEYKNSMEEQCKQYVNLNKAGQSNLKETEKIIISELRKIPDKVEIKQTELHSQLIEDIKNCFDLNNRDSEEIIKHSVDQYFNKHHRKLDEIMTSAQKGSIQDIVKQQLEMMSCKLGNVINSHTLKNNEQLTNIQDTLSGSIQQMNDLLQYKCLQTDALAQLEVRLSKFQSTITQQLNKIEGRYLVEIKELENEIYKRTRFTTDSGITEKQENTGGSNIYLQPACMKETTPTIASRNLPVGQSHNNSHLASSIATAIYRTSASTCKDSISNCHVGSSNSHINVQTCNQDLKNYNRHLTEIAHSKVILNSQVGNVRNPVNLAPITNAPENVIDLESVHCHPNAHNEVSSKSKGNLAIPCQKFERHKKMSNQDTVTGAQPEMSPRPKKRGNKKKAARGKKDISTKYVENMTVIHTKAGHSSQTGVWTRSHYKSVQQVQAAPHSDFQKARDSNKFTDSNKCSWPGSENIRIKCDSTPELSIYDFTGGDEGNQPVFSRKRAHVSNDPIGNMSLASFISNGFIEKRKNQNCEHCSECSSPTISVTEVTIRRKVKTPFRRPYNNDVLSRPYVDTGKIHSSTPTLLSDISGKH